MRCRRRECVLSQAELSARAAISIRELQKYELGLAPIFFEAASLRSEGEPAPPPFALLESVSEIRTASGRRVAMEAIHAVLMQEAAMNDNVSIERLKA